MQHKQNRRRFVAGLTAAGALGLSGAAASVRAEPPPEITSIRLPYWMGYSYCWAAPLVAGELLHAEGFTDVQYVQGDFTLGQSDWIARGQTDFSMNYPLTHLESIEAGAPIKIIGGLHAGCTEIIASDTVQSVAGLKGKRVGEWGLNQSSYKMLSLMISYVGLNPARDIEWVWTYDPPQLFAEGKIEAFLATPPLPQQMHAKKLGHAILNTTTDAPWSQQYCCMISARSDYVSNYPVATKRALRAILKAADICASNPTKVARQLFDSGFVQSYDTALQTLSDIRYGVWRDYDPEAILVFYALRMHEIGMIKSSPREIVAASVDWRFFNELRSELKT